MIVITNASTVELVGWAGGDLSVVSAARVSTLTDIVAQEALTEADHGLINFLMKNRHGSPFEHNMMQFRVHAPIAVFREWHRHRIGQSYNEQSGRYTKFEPVFYLPPADRPMVQVGKVGAYEFEPIDPEAYSEMAEIMAANFAWSWGDYERMIDIGVAKEVARGVLPVYIMSTMYVTMNARSCMAFLSLRRKKNFDPDAPDAVFPSFPMYEIDDCAEQVEQHFAELFPVTYTAFINNGRVAP